jgi:N-acetylneuraminic acid mutarotase
MLGGWGKYIAGAAAVIFASGLAFALAPHDPPLARSNHGLIWQNDKLLVLGGHGGGQDLSTVLRSSDGKTWRTVATQTPWGARSYIQPIEVNGRVLVIGGYRFGAAGNVLADVWQSADGQRWELLTDTPAWEAREHYGVVSLNGHVYLFGGVTYLNPDPGGHLRAFADVWRSTDGKSWELVTGKAPWGPRRGFGFGVLKGRMFLFGGLDSQDHLYNDVWSSADGKDWRKEATAPWAPRSAFSSAVFRDRLWVFGGWCGYAGGYVGDIWSTADGKTWRQETNKAPWGPRSAFRPAIGNERLWIVSGSTPDGPPKDDVWVSRDGATWDRLR